MSPNFAHTIGRITGYLRFVLKEFLEVLDPTNDKSLIQEIKSMMTLLSIGAGGFLGSISRYFLSTQVHLRLGSDFPYGTLVVNALGSFVLGWLAGYAYEHIAISEELRQSVTVGFLGAFTTFSTFSYETVILMQSGDYWKMGINMLSNVLICLILCILGLELVKTI